jgi:uncharacterized membrane protein YqjE
MNSRNFALIAAAFALIGLVVNVAFDLDNVYDMTTSTLWVLTLVFALLGVFIGRNK